MDEAKVSQHAAELSNMENEYLLGLWNTAGPDDLTPEGLQALRQVLKQRLGLLPRKGVLYEPAAFRGQDTYYDKEKIETLSVRLHGFSTLFLGLTILAVIAVMAAFIGTAVTLADPAGTGPNLVEIVYSAAGLFPFVEGALVAATLVYVLRAASEGLLLLMDIESNTRAAQRPQSEPDRKSKE